MQRKQVFKFLKHQIFLLLTPTKTDNQYNFFVFCVFKERIVNFQGFKIFLQIIQII